jgi:type II restriction enzyme
LTEIEVDENGNVVVPRETVINKQNELFGDKVYDISPVTDAIEKSIAEFPSEDHVPKNVSTKIVDVAMDLAKPIIVDTVKIGFDLTNAQADKIEKNLKNAITEKITKVENENYRSSLRSSRRLTRNSGLQKNRSKKMNSNRLLKR